MSKTRILEVKTMLFEADSAERAIRSIDPVIIDTSIEESAAVVDRLLKDLNEVSRDVTCQSQHENKAERFYGQAAGRDTLLSHVPDLFYNQDRSMTAARFADVCVTTFNHLHPAYQFYPGTEPLPINCRFCDKCLLGEPHESRHTKLCAFETMTQGEWAGLNPIAQIPSSKRCSLRLSGTRETCSHS